MNKIRIVAKNELKRYFLSPLAYVYLISFLLLNGSFALYFGHFFERGSADLSPMFAYQPWLYLLFISGISMRLWAEEFRSKSVVQIVTMPVSVAQLVWGKFLASWLFCAIALVLTFPFVVTVHLLGNPDDGVIVSGYLASFILAGCMLAVSQTMSALTKNQVIALVLAVIANLIFFLSGLEYVLSFFRLFAPLSIVDMIASFSFLTHFDTMAAGLLELRDLVFFVSLILLFNFATILIVSFKTSGTSRILKSGSKNYYILLFVILLIGFAGLNLLANTFLRRIQYDFTEEKVFAVTEQTARVLKNIKHPVTAKLYYSKILEERNPALRQMFDKVRILLRRYAALSDGKFGYRIYDPEMLSEKEDQALAAGIQPLPVVDMNRNAFFGMSLTDELDNHAVIPFFAMERFDYLEQDLTAKIYALGRKKKTVGLLTPLSIFDTIQDNNVVTQKWEVINLLEEVYVLKKIEKVEDIDGIDALLMIHPRNLSEAVVRKIKDYSNAGGRILLFADVAPEAARIYSPSNNDLLPSDLSGLDSFWGFRLNTEVAAADLTNSVTVDATNNYKTNPTFTQDVLQFILKPANFNAAAPEMARLKEILMASAAVVEPLAGADERVRFIPLMSLSLNSALMPSYLAQQSIPPEMILQDFKPDMADKVVAAKIVSKSGEHPFEVIVVADSDMLYDSFWSRNEVVLDNKYVVPVLDNANFMLNALESLTGETAGLTGLRGKSSVRRPFAEIEKMRRNNERAYKLKEAEVFAKISEAKRDLQEVWGKKNFEERVNFNADELAVISGIRKRLEALRLELGKIRSEANAEIRNIDFRVKFFNIYFVPFLIIVFLAGAFWVNHPRRLSGSRMVFSPSLLWAGAGALSLLAGGLFSVYYADGVADEQMEGRAVFADLPEKINDVERLMIKGHDAVLNFYKKDGVWRLDNPAGVPVYQSRIRSFLSALLEARYYERKTSNAEYLRMFDLNPVAEDGSKNIRIELKNAEGKVLEGFEVGRYDVEIGRGAKAAYLKFDNRFQVWLAAVDFVDLSTNWEDWTYSTLWNLRFGRLQSVNGSAKAEDIATLMKYVLNMKLEKEAAALKCWMTQTASFELAVEGGSSVLLNFYECGGLYYAQYDFRRIVDNNHLQFFEGYAKGRFYQVSATDVEKIKYVFGFNRTGKTKTP